MIAWSVLHVHQMTREIVDVIQLVLVERIIDRVADQMDIPVPRVMEEFVAVVQVEAKLVLQERGRTVEQVPVPQFLDETVEVVLAPTERV